MIYTHLARKGPAGVTSLLDMLPPVNACHPERTFYEARRFLLPFVTPACYTTMQKTLPI